MAQAAARLAALPVTQPSVMVGPEAHPASGHHSLIADGVAVSTANDAVDGATNGAAARCPSARMMEQPIVS